VDVNDIFDEYTDLLGAYALDAVEPDERERIELHLVECPRCRAEVSEHREVAAFLSQSGAQAPDGVWDRIVSELSPPAPPMRMRLEPVASDVEASNGPSPVAAVTPIGAARSARSKTMLAFLAAAACIVAVLGFVTVGQSNRLNRLESAVDDQSIESLANDFVADSEVMISLEGDGGSAEAVVRESGQGFLILDDLPAPADGNVYQLWGQVDETIISLGTFSDGSSVVPFSVDPNRLDDLELVAVTQEKAPGVASSQNTPVLAGTI
jgi:hypothetical protein